VTSRDVQLFVGYNFRTDEVVVAIRAVPRRAQMEKPVKNRSRSSLSAIRSSAQPHAARENRSSVALVSRCSNLGRQKGGAWGRPKCGVCGKYVETARTISVDGLVTNDVVPFTGFSVLLRVRIRFPIWGGGS
jgi:hypothetical protein